MNWPMSTEVYDAYWRFAAERFAMLERRLAGETAPWTVDPILAEYRFTNTFRITDRVSQYLISDVQGDGGVEYTQLDIVFRTLLFKTFNRISTWKLLTSKLNEPLTANVSRNTLSVILSEALSRGERVYSAAYIMPSPAYGHARKHENHLAQLFSMLDGGTMKELAAAKSLREAFGILAAQPGLGPFLAYQYA